MNTTFILMAQYGATAIIPVELVCRDYFTHLTPESFVRKISAGKIALPLTRIDSSSRGGRGIHLLDLARWIDERAEAARKECRQLCG